MVLSTEYSEAVNARYTFQPLWVSDNIHNKTTEQVQLQSSRHQNKRFD